MASALQKILTIKQYLLNHGPNSCLKVVNAVTLLPKKAYFHFFFLSQTDVAVKKQINIPNNLNLLKGVIKSEFDDHQDIGLSSIIQPGTLLAGDQASSWYRSEVLHCFPERDLQIRRINKVDITSKQSNVVKGVEAQ